MDLESIRKIVEIRTCKVRHFTPIIKDPVNTLNFVMGGLMDRSTDRVSVTSLNNDDTKF